MVQTRKIALSIGEKLRRAAAKADVSNLVINPPMVRPAAWAPSTAYVTGDVRSNGGNWYMCVGSGTSAASGGPSNTTTGGAATDGGALWTYLGGPSILADDSGAPTISTQNTTPSGLTNYWNCISYPSLFKVLGGYVTTFATNYWKIFGFNTLAATPGVRTAAIEFYTDAPKFAIGITNGAPNYLRIAVDDRYLTVDHIAATGGATPNWFVVDYSSTTVRKIRKVRIENPNGFSFTFAGVRTTALDMVYPPPSLDDVRMVGISDSIYAGSSYGPFLIGGTAVQRISKLLGWNDAYDMSSGGTGYIATNSGASYNFGQRVADTTNAAIIATADVVVLFGSTNDIGQSGIAAAVTAAIQAVRALNSKCVIIVFGVWPLNNAGVAATEAAVQSGVTAAADPLTFFIPLYADPTLPWVTGSWNNAANTGSTSATMFISGDNTHPPDLGTAYLAHRQAQAIKTSVLPNL